MREASSEKETVLFVAIAHANRRRDFRKESIDGQHLPTVLYPLGWRFRENGRGEIHLRQLCQICLSFP